MRYTGASSRSDAIVYNSVKDAYLEAIEIVLTEKANDRSDRGAHSDLCSHVTADGFWKVEDRKVFSIIRDVSTGDRELEMRTTSRAIDSASMCREVGDSLHFAMVGGSIFPHYSEYMDESPIVDTGRVFIQEVIDRARKRGGNSPTPHHYMERCESIAEGGRCALFPPLTLVADTDCNIDACQSVMRRIC